MAELATVPPTTLTLLEQADFLLALWDRTFMRSDGAPAASVTMTLTREDGDTLAAIGHRLARMAPHQSEIVRLVTGRQE